MVAATCDNHCYLTLDQISRQSCQPVVLTFRKAIFDRYVLAFDIAGFFRPLRNATTKCAAVPDVELWRYPMTGLVGCCARAASGHAAAPPKSMMNSRRFI